MLNNKGFAISSVLYLLLVAFLMFLMLMLAQFTSSTSVIGKANDDLINGTKFEAQQYKPGGFIEYIDINSNKQIPLDAANNKYSINCVGMDKVSEHDSSVLSFSDYDNTKNPSYTLYKNRYWYETNTIIRIKTRSGTYKYWPRDFEGNEISILVSDIPLNSGYTDNSGKINVSYDSAPSDITYGNYGQLTFTDDKGNGTIVVLNDICQ